MSLLEVEVARENADACAMLAERKGDLPTREVRHEYALVAAALALARRFPVRVHLPGRKDRRGRWLPGAIQAVREPGRGRADLDGAAASAFAHPRAIVKL